MSLRAVSVIFDYTYVQFLDKDLMPNSLASKLTIARKWASNVQTLSNNSSFTSFLLMLSKVASRMQLCHANFFTFFFLSIKVCT